MKGLLLLLYLFLPAAAPPADPEVATLVLRVENLQPSTGTLWVGIYRSADDFLDREKARLVHLPVGGSGTMRVPIDGLLVGHRYAIAVFQDTNDNGELDTNFLGLPAEPYALSRPLKSWFRMPRFREMSFVFDPQRGLPPLRLR
ncbi:DUF2141 domain-containing protein [Lewinella sp. IMCC34183]|uniref:DUF2141 domain-containing protein n=1 Tax=Lewinella sp. IMCC34183 TaxID=2248762 RepID=UPI000E258720|nr:DUF2141 domain-containing protein [Lewinella sp. IMCC34183]